MSVLDNIKRQNIFLRLFDITIYFKETEGLSNILVSLYLKNKANLFSPFALTGFSYIEYYLYMLLIIPQIIHCIINFIKQLFQYFMDNRGIQNFKNLPITLPKIANLWLKRHRRQSRFFLWLILEVLHATQYPKQENPACVSEKKTVSCLLQHKNSNPSLPKMAMKWGHFRL